MDVFKNNWAYRHFSIASFLSGAGDILFYLAFMTYASSLKNYSLALSLIAISESVPKFLDIFGGYLADRTFNKLKNIFWTSLIRFGLYGLVAFLLISQLSQWTIVLAIIAINFVSDVIGAYSTGLVAPVIVDLVGEKDFGQAEGFTSGIGQIISIATQFVGAALLMIMSYSSLAFVNALTFLAAGLLFASVGKKQQEANIAPISINQQGLVETMKSAFVQVNKQSGLLITVCVIALINGALDATTPMLSIVIAGNKDTMVISTYSFTIALISVCAGIGMALGSIYGVKLFEKASVFSIAIVASALSLAVALAIVSKKIYLIMLVFMLLAASASIASIKLTQWLVESVEQTILASTVGLLNTILMATAPLITTLITSISGIAGSVTALLTLAFVEFATLVLAIAIAVKR